MADTYIKTFDIDETFVMEDDNNGPDIQAFHLEPNSVDDMYLWSNAFVAASGNSPGLYAWVTPMALDLSGNPLDNFYNNAGVLFVVTGFSTYGDPTLVRLHGQVKVVYQPVVPNPA